MHQHRTSPLSPAHPSTISNDCGKTAVAAYTNAAVFNIASAATAQPASARLGTQLIGRNPANPQTGAADSKTAATDDRTANVISPQPPRPNLMPEQAAEPSGMTQDRIDLMNAAAAAWTAYRIASDGQRVGTMDSPPARAAFRAWKALNEQRFPSTKGDVGASPRQPAGFDSVYPGLGVIAAVGSIFVDHPRLGAGAPVAAGGRAGAVAGAGEGEAGAAAGVSAGPPPHLIVEATCGTLYRVTDAPELAHAWSGVVVRKAKGGGYVPVVGTRGSVARLVRKVGCRVVGEFGA